MSTAQTCWASPITIADGALASPVAQVSLRRMPSLESQKACASPPRVVRAKVCCWVP